MKKLFLFSSIIISTIVSASQNEAVLMTIDGHDITVDEFLRIYRKNRDITPNDDQKSVDEYVDLFVNYKLKVIEAENLGYDTVPGFIKELEGYRDQLAKPYLEDTTVTKKLIKEAYERNLYEVNASHILVKVDQNALPEDTLKAWEKITSIRKRILAGEPFEEVAKGTSDDTGMKKNNGYLGWFSVFQMVYEFETVAYNTPVGEISEPVRTRFGYHIIKVNDKRKSRGRRHVAHIMTETPPNATDFEIQSAKEKIEKAYQALEDGMEWEEAVKEYSEHRNSRTRGGDIGWLRSGNVPEAFLDTCFALDSGAYSKPIQTDYGFHIVKAYEVVPIESLDEVRDKIKSRVNKDRSRRDYTTQSFNTNIKKKYGFKLYNETIADFYDRVDSSFYDGKWTADKATDLNTPMFTIGETDYTQNQFAKFLEEKVKRSSKKVPLRVLIDKKFNDFQSESLLEYKKKKLEEEYPEYKNLLVEYHDGILLFNLTNDYVWQKASEDTSGLKDFYNNLEEKYMWKERINMSEFTFTDKSLKPKIIKVAKKRLKKGFEAEDIPAFICPDDSIPCVEVKDKIYERNDNSVADAMEWTKGYYKEVVDDDKFILYFVNDILPVSIKKLNEARGLYIADYQAYLEKEWIDSLREKYSIKINEDLLQKIE